MDPLENFLSFFTSRFPKIGASILELLNPMDFIQIMHSCPDIKDFIMEDAKLIELFMKKAKSETGKGGLTSIRWKYSKYFGTSYNFTAL